MHLLHFAAALAQHLHHRAGGGLAALHVHFFERLQRAAFVVFFQNDLGPPHLEFVTFAAHSFDQDGQVQLAAPGNHEGVGAVGLFDAQREIAAQLVEQPLAQFAAGAPFAFAPRERRSIDPKGDAHRRLFHVNDRQRHWVLRVRQRLADGDIFQARDSDDITCTRLRHLDALQAFLNV